MAKGKRLAKNKKEVVIREGAQAEEIKNAQPRKPIKKPKETPEQREIRLLKKQAEKEAKKEAKKAKKEEYSGQYKEKKKPVNFKNFFDKAKTLLIEIPTKKLIVAVIALVMAVSGVAFYMNRDSISFDNFTVWLRTTFIGDGMGEGYPVNIPVTAAGNIENISGNSVILSDTELLILSTVGEELFSKRHNYENPSLVVENNEIIIYDMGKTKYEKVDIYGNATEYEHEDGIMGIKLSKSGKVAFSKQAQDYASRFEVYTKDDELQFAYSFSSDYMTEIAINDEGTLGAVSTINTENGALVSTVYVFDFTKEEPIAKYSMNQNMIYSMGFSDSGALYCVGESQTLVMDSEYNFESFSYGGENLTAVKITNNKALVSISPYTTSGSCTVLVFEDSAVPYTIETENMVTGIDSKGVVVGVLEENEVITYSIVSGMPIGICEAGIDAKNISMVNESDVYMLCMGEIKFDTLVNYS